MIEFDDFTKVNIKGNNPNWPQIPDHPYRILIVEDSVSEKKTTSLFNLISQQPDIDKIYLYAKNPYKTKYQLLINKQESAALNHLNDSVAFIECSKDMNDVYKNIEEYNPNKKRTIFLMI